MDQGFVNTGIDFSMNDPGIVPSERLLPLLDALRQAAPVYWSKINQCWQITGYDAVSPAYNDARFSNNRQSSFAWRSIPPEQWEEKIPNLLRYTQSWIVNVDGPHHQRLRAVGTKALNRRFVDSLTPRIQEISTELTEKAIRLGTVDFYNDIAYYLPATVVLLLLGIPLEHLEKVREWSRAITSALVAPFSPPELLIACDKALGEINDLMRVEIAKRKEQPQNDLLTQLVHLADDSNKTLSEDEIFGLAHILLTAGHDTTVNTLTLGLDAFAKNPEQAKLFLEGAVDPLTAMQEVSRFTAMSTCQPRVVGEDFEFGGQPLKKGDVAFLWIASGNHDPAKFPNPGAFDITRPNLGDVLTFGPGLHHCLGHYIARVELAVFFKIFLARVTKIEILDEPLDWAHMLIFRTVRHLNVRLTA